MSLTVSSGGSAPPTSPTAPTAADQAPCSSGYVSYTESADTGFVCVEAGSTLRVTFVSSGGASADGVWSASPPTISDNAVLEGRAWGSSGKKATAVFRAIGAGAATVTASFDRAVRPFLTRRRAPSLPRRSKS